MSDKQLTVEKHRMPSEVTDKQLTHNTKGDIMDSTTRAITAVDVEMMAEVIFDNLEKRVREVLKEELDRAREKFSHYMANNIKGEIIDPDTKVTDALDMETKAKVTTAGEEIEMLIREIVREELDHHEELHHLDTQPTG